MTLDMTLIVKYTDNSEVKRQNIQICVCKDNRRQAEKEVGEKEFSDLCLLLVQSLWSGFRSPFLKHSGASGNFLESGMKNSDALKMVCFT